jgi:hypothetical protein
MRRLPMNLAALALGAVAGLLTPADAWGSVIIYGVAGDGALLWYQHKGSKDGDGDAWDGPKQVGEGWQDFKHVFSGGDGIVYAIQKDGKLLWYRHKGHKDGGDATTWDGPNQVGVGWQDLRPVFCVPQ